MQKTFTVFTLFLYLLFFNSTAKASIPDSADFCFLGQDNNSSLVEDKQLLVEYAVALSISALVNFYGWYVACETLGIVSGVAREGRMETPELVTYEQTKTDMCLRLASAVTTTEVVLAGVSPSMPPGGWYQALRSAGLGLALRGRYAASGDCKTLPIAALVYLSGEAIERIIFNALVSRYVTITDKTDISSMLCVYDEGKRLTSINSLKYILLSFIDAALVGLLVIEALHLKDINAGNTAIFVVVPIVWAALSIISVNSFDGSIFYSMRAEGYAVSTGLIYASLALIVLSIALVQNVPPIIVDIAGAAVPASEIKPFGAGIGILTGVAGGVVGGVVLPYSDIPEVGVEIGVVVGIGFGILAAGVTGTTPGIIVGLGSAAGAAAGVGIGSGVMAGIVPRLKDGIGAALKVGVRTGVRTGAGAGAGSLLFLISSKMSTDNPVSQGGATIATVLMFALIDSLSKYIAYGDSIEDSLFETNYIFWNKFFVPLGDLLNSRKLLNELKNSL